METFGAILPWIQIVLSVLLVASILLQRSGSEVGGALGGDGAGFYHTKRGLEKFLFVLTVILAILFALSALAVVLLK